MTKTAVRYESDTGREGVLAAEAHGIHGPTDTEEGNEATEEDIRKYTDRSPTPLGGIHVEL